MKILFPVTNRVHKARQQLLLKELEKYFEVVIFDCIPKGNSIAQKTLDITNEFSIWLGDNHIDLALIRADRFEMLPIAMICAYKGIPIAHIEGGDLSGAIDNKVRYAITALADLHFPTNRESAERIRMMNKDNIYNFGSLDVEYAKSVQDLNQVYANYVVMCHHAMQDEDPAIIEKIIRDEFSADVFVVKSNSDNGKPYGDKEYTPEEYIDLIKHAKCLVGNSSSFIKEASAFGTPVVLIGERQKNRLLTENVKQVPYHKDFIRKAIKDQLHAFYKPSDIYYQQDTSKKIVYEIKQFLT